MVATNEGFQLTFVPHEVYMGGSRIAVHQGPGYIRVVGRDQFPHVYDKADKMNLFNANWRAPRALAMIRLPANYSYQMYAVIAGKQQRWLAGVQPSTYKAMTLAE